MHFPPTQPVTDMPTLSHRSRRPMPALLLVLLLLAAATTATAQNFEHDQVIRETFKVRAGQTLHLKADLGAIVLRGDRGDEVRVTVTKGTNRTSRAQAEALFDRYAVDFEETARGLEIRGRFDRSDRWRNHKLQVRYEITVPERFDVDLETSGGSIRVSQLDGHARLHTSGGSVDVEGITGPTDVHTSGGSITAERLGDKARLRTSGGAIRVDGVRGPLEVKTSGGSIRIDDVQGDVQAHTSGGGIRLTGIAGALDAETSGGGIEAEIVGAVERPVSLNTSGGGITLHLDRRVRADLDARASGGRVRLDFPVELRGEVKRDRVSGTLNGGGPRISVRSSGGGVTIRER